MDCSFAIFGVAASTCASTVGTVAMRACTGRATTYFILFERWACALACVCRRMRSSDLSEMNTTHLKVDETTKSDWNSLRMYQNELAKFRVCTVARKANGKNDEKWEKKRGECSHGKVHVSLCAPLSFFHIATTTPRTHHRMAAEHKKNESQCSLAWIIIKTNDWRNVISVKARRFDSTVRWTFVSVKKKEIKIGRTKQNKCA